MGGRARRRSGGTAGWKQVSGTVQVGSTQSQRNLQPVFLNLPLPQPLPHSFSHPLERFAGMGGSQLLHAALEAI